LGAEPELSERAFRAIWRTGHNGDSRPSTGSARTHATAFTQTDGSLDGTRKESAVIWLKYRDALGVLHHGLAGSERGAPTPIPTGWLLSRPGVGRFRGGLDTPGRGFLIVASISSKTCGS